MVSNRRFWFVVMLLCVILAYLDYQNDKKTSQIQMLQDQVETLKTNQSKVIDVMYNKLKDK